jgi:hypothetical protein
MRLRTGDVVGVVLALLLGFSSTATAQSSSGLADDELDVEAVAPAYRESALRRMEIVTFVSLPFTSIHSYLIVRSVRMLQHGSVAAGLSGDDWTYVGIGAASLSLGIALYDWNRLRGKDRNEPLLPETPSRSSAARVSISRGFHRPWLSASVRF